MNKDVLVRVSGLHIAPEGGTDIPVEVTTRGEYYFKNDRHYLFYEEVAEGFSGTTKNRVIFSEDRLEITKKGVVNAHLLFERGNRNSTFYHTPFGNITIGIDTQSLSLSVEEDRIDVKIRYALEMNGGLVANCAISLEVLDCERADFRLA